MTKLDVCKLFDDVIEILKEELKKPLRKLDLDEIDRRAELIYKLRQVKQKIGCPTTIKKKEVSGGIGFIKGKYEVIEEEPELVCEC